MPINEPLEPTKLTPMDRAVIEYHAAGENFLHLLDYYISAFPEAKRYTFFGPNYILLGHEETLSNPMDPKSPRVPPYWYVAYAQALSPKQIVDLMPYPLDMVGFSRYLKYPDKPVKFLPIKRFL